MSNPALFPVPQFFDTAGNPLAGGKIYGWVPSSTTPKDLYQDAGLTLKHARPIILSALGVPPAPIWCDGETFINWTDASDAPINIDYDNFNKSASGLGAYSTKNSGVITKSTTYSLTSGDDGNLLVITSGTWTLSTDDTAANLGNGFFVDVINAGPGVVTFDPNGSEVVDYGSGGSTTLLIPPQAHLRLTCDGGQWYAEFSNRSVVPGRNRVINGDVRVDQRNDGSAVTVNTTGAFYGPDLWRGFGDSADGVFTIARATSSPPAGFTTYLRIIVTTADAAIGASQRYGVATVFEGLNMQDLGFGTADAKLCTIGFWARSSLTGDFSGAVRNGVNNRSFPFTFTINAANTWEFKVITVPGDTSGTWPTDTSLWGAVVFDLGAGTSMRGTALAWGANYYGATNSVSLIGTLGATLDITGLQFEEGGFATTFEQLTFDAILRRCARYYQRFMYGESSTRQTAPIGLVSSYLSASAIYYTSHQLNTPMRAAPNWTRSAATWSATNSGQPALRTSDASSFTLQAMSSAAGHIYVIAVTPTTGYTLDAEL